MTHFYQLSPDAQVAQLASEEVLLARALARLREAEAFNAHGRPADSSCACRQWPCPCPCHRERKR